MYEFGILSLTIDKQLKSKMLAEIKVKFTLQNVRLIQTDLSHMEIDVIIVKTLNKD